MGFGFRLALWNLSQGSDDIRIWNRFAQMIDEHGLGNTYVRDSTFNHPPLMGLWARTVLHVSTRWELPFPQCFKVLGLCSELGSALLLACIWRCRGRPNTGAAAFAAYGCGAVGILISGFHGNTDPVYWFLMLGAAYMLHQRDAPLLGGVAVAAAINVKLIPLLIVLPLAACCKNLRDVVRYAAGGLMGLAPFAIVLGFDEEQQAAFYKNCFGYTSLRDNWGIESIELGLLAAFSRSAPTLAAAVNTWGALYAAQGSKCLLALTTLLAFYQVVMRRPGLDAYAMAALSCCLFLVLASGFGVQYLGAPIPLLLACRVRDGFIVTCVVGLFLGLTYCSFVVLWTPITTYHRGIVAELGGFSALAWGSLVWAGAKVWRWRRRPSDARAFLDKRAETLSSDRAPQRVAVVVDPG